LGTSQFLKPFK